MNYDIIIVGAGPTGLAFAQLVSHNKIKTLVVEKSSLENIKNPNVDGREIALTHSSVEVLKKINTWENIPKDDISYINKAHVLNGNCEETLVFDAKKENIKNLGYLVPNYLIKKGIYKRVKNNPNITIKTDVEVKTIKDYKDKKIIVLNNDEEYRTKLIIGADSRFSTMRKQVGITAKMKDFAKTMLVCEMQHDIAHEQIASEYFHYDKIIATLPMPNNHSSIVITLENEQAKNVQNMPNKEFNQYVENSLNKKLGNMKLLGKIHSYPLIGVYADSFIKERFALIGDAAVGMHPVTAHGFNLGLRGSEILANAIIKASRRNQDIGSINVLSEYQRKYKLISKIMYLGTNSLVTLFSQKTPIMKLIRKFAIKSSIKIPLVNKLISAHLTEKYRKQRNLFPFL